jgi:hypothetical protein
MVFVMLIASLDFALHCTASSGRIRFSSRSGSIRTKLSLAGTVTMTVKGQFGGSPQNGDAVSSELRQRRRFDSPCDMSIWRILETIKIENTQRYREVLWLRDLDSNHD